MQNYPVIKFLKIIFYTQLLMVFACQQSGAPIVNRGAVVYNRSVYKNKDNKSPQFVNVSAGENIYSISRKYNVPLRDLISKNNLTPPYLVKVGDKINLPSNQYHQVVEGDTLYGISRQYGMNVNNLISINDLKRPYSIRVGEKLKISGSAVPDNKASVAYTQAKNSPTKTANKSNKIISQELSEPIIANKNNHFLIPVKGVVVSRFGAKPGGLYNDGVNIKAKSGDNVKATEDGAVAYVGNELRGYGNLIIIKHSGGWISAYGHLDKTKVKRGSKVKKGENIATVGTTGNVKFPQLYFGLRKGREAVNPQNYL
jgi:murein DD-endopeptidase MepM/ murein hydrolase activator NlpD